MRSRHLAISRSHHQSQHSSRPDSQGSHPNWASHSNARSVQCAVSKLLWVNLREDISSHHRTLSQTAAVYDQANWSPHYGCGTVPNSSHSHDRLFAQHRLNNARLRGDSEVSQSARHNDNDGPTGLGENKPGLFPTVVPIDPQISALLPCLQGWAYPNHKRGIPAGIGVLSEEWPYTLHKMLYCSVRGRHLGVEQRIRRNWAFVWLDDANLE